ncbi:hypothetical protein SK128_010911, partial [Halocaridina rubra]
MMEAQSSKDTTEMLIKGVQEGNIDVVEKALCENPNLDVLVPCKDGINRTLMGLVAFLDHAHLVAPLAAVGISIEGRGSRFFTPLLHAAREKNSKVLKELVKAGADINARSSEADDRMEWGTVNNKSMQELYDIFCEEQRKWVAGKWDDSLSHLLCPPFYAEKNINVDIQDDIGFAPIHVASRVNCISILNRLIDARAHLHPRTMQGWTPLHVASMSGSLEAVKRLLELDLDIYAEDKEGRTPSDLADECGRSDVYWHFIKKAGQEEKSTLTLPLKSGNRYNWEERLLNWTRQGEERYINLVKYNQPEPYDGHFQDSKGYTTLHIAAEMGNFNFVRVLVEDCRTFAAALNWQNQTPADLARANGYGDIAEYLDNAVQQPKTAKEAENLYLQLLETIGKGDDVRRAADLLFQGAPLEPTGQHSTNALILAVTTNRRRILTLLIAAGAPITTVFQEHNILQIAWLSPNISTFIRMIITRAIGYILEIELMMLDPCETELQEGIYALLKCIRSNKPWTARWPNTTQKLDFIKQRSCRNEPEIKENSESSYHLSYLMRKAVQFGAKLTTAFLQQAGGITFVNDANMEGSPFTLAIKFKHWIIVNQMAKSSACLYMPDVQGQLPKDHLPPQRRRILEN